MSASGGEAVAAPGRAGRPARTGGRARAWAAVLAVAAAAIAVLSVRLGATGAYGWAETARGILATLGLAEPLDGVRQTIVELRAWRTLTTLGVGASLALSGALLQGVFRNDLASPSVLGVSTGASLGASLAIVVVGGFGPSLVVEAAAGAAPAIVTASAFTFALAVSVLVTRIATSAGRVSVPTLLLVGIALNAILGGALAALQSLLLDRYDVARALFTWSFGTLDDRGAWHVALLAGGLAVAVLAVPFVTVELDLFAAGEEDAEALGVDTRRIKLIALGAASLSAAVAVSVAGQIAFVGLVVPHLVRLLVGRSHRVVLPLSLLGGAVFLGGTDLAQRALFPTSYLQPGVVMSLVGGPFFLMLLVRERARIRAW